jgi:hypothetical protein
VSASCETPPRDQVSSGGPRPRAVRNAPLPSPLPAGSIVALAGRGSSIGFQRPSGVSSHRGSRLPRRTLSSECPTLRPTSLGAERRGWFLRRGAQEVPEQPVEATRTDTKIPKPDSRRWDSSWQRLRSALPRSRAREFVRRFLDGRWERGSRCLRSTTISSTMRRETRPPRPPFVGVVLGWLRHARLHFRLGWCPSVSPPARRL